MLLYFARLSDRLKLKRRIKIVSYTATLTVKRFLSKITSGLSIFSVYMLFC
jgi:hypothetical protein